MSVISGAMLACGDCASRLAPKGQPLTVILLIAALAIIGCAILLWQRRRRRRPPRVTDQWSALVAMGDLCPGGWQAEITVQGGIAAMPGDGAPDTPAVALEWKLYENDGARVAISRRVSADTIGGALQGMVDDRRLDVMLEQIERSTDRGEDRV